MHRRRFVTAAGLAGAAAALGACAPGRQSAECAAGERAEPVEWKMVTAWPRDFPAVGTGANRLAENIGRLSGGRLTVRVYGANELVPPYEVFDAVARGTADLGHAASYYWKGKIPAAQFFSGVPFGLTAQELNGWLYHGEGMALYHEAYAPFGVIPFPVGNSGTQMGGWFKREINSLDDLRGLKIRMPGLGGEVLARAGATVQNIPGAELFTALQTGTIDATEWIGPLNDLAFGLFRAAPFYYYPGWHEPGTSLEALVNREAYDALPGDLQAVVETACKAATLDMLSDFMAHNGPALKRLVDEHGVQLRRFPDDVMAELERISGEILDELAESDPLSGRVWTSLKAFAADVRPFTDVAERALLQTRPARS